MDKTYEKLGFVLNTETHKLCNCCKEVKPRTDYYKNKARKDGIGTQCKLCEAAKQRERNQRPEVKARLYEYHARYREENREQFRESQQRYRDKNYDKLKEQRLSEEGQRIQREYQRNRRRNDPAYRLKHNVSRQVHHALVGKHKAGSTFDHLPYTQQQLKEHLENQFDDKMTWDNYGTYWHVDHIYPQSRLPFDSLDHVNFLTCWALTNLRPLEARENMSKGNKVIDELVEGHKE